MRTCPHCEASIANLAEQCPECRQHVGERTPVASDIIDAERLKAALDPAPDYSGYLWLGAVLIIVGVCIGAASGGGAGAVVGVLLSAVGAASLLIGCIGLGVYIGLRQHQAWLDRREE